MDKKEKIEQLNAAVYKMSRIRKELVCTQLQNKEKIIDPHSMMVLKAILKLNKGEAVTVNEIAEHFQFSKAAASKVITKLYNKGYVEKIINKEDRRSYLINVTDDTKKLIAETDEEVMTLFERLLDEMEEQDINDLIRIINEVAKILKNIKGGK